MQRKGPLPGKIFARCILQRRFAGLFGYMARTSCQSQLVFGCMARESCQEGAIFPSEAPFGMHGVKKLPRIAARERTAAKSRHGKAPGNASRENLVTVGRRENAFRGHFAIGECPGTHQGTILPSPGPGNTSMKNLHNRHLTIVYKTLTRNQAEYNKEIGF